MRGAPLALALLALATPAAAQLRPFSCVGAERLEADAVTIAFTRSSDRVGNTALEALGPLAAAAREAPARNLCIIGFASNEEGGAETQSALAARRARVLALELSKMGVERDRIRAEARTRGFTQGRGPAGVERSAAARVVLMPADPPANPG
jgi:outer membrane protein OmpA-like peptidoglycan-associated protein